MTVREYIGARYVPLFMGQWDIAVDYEALCVVQYQGDSYTSRQPVPAGTDIFNEDYWLESGNYNAQVEAYRQEVFLFDARIDDLEDAVGDEDSGLIKRVTDNENDISDIKEDIEGIGNSIVAINGNIETIENDLDKANAVKFYTCNWSENQLHTSYFGVRISREFFKVDLNSTDGENHYVATKTPFDFVRTHPNVILGHNCDFGSASMTRPTRINGVNYNTTEPAHFYPLLAVDTENQEFQMYPSYTLVTSIPVNYDYAFSISHQLVQNGVANSIFDNYTGQDTNWNTTIEPRIGFGYDDDYFYVLFCEGRDKCERGMSMSEFSHLFTSLWPSIDNAYNLDGGGSIDFAVNSPNAIRINRIKDFDLKYDKYRNNLLVMYYVEKD